MKVGFFLSGVTGIGGIGRVASILCNEFVKNPEIEIVLISYAGSQKSPLYELESKIKKVNLFTNNISMKSAILKGGVKKLRTIISENNLDILVSCGALYYPISILACKRTHTKCICWEHTAPNISNDYAFQMESRIFGARRSSANVLITHAAKEEYDSKIAKKARNITIYNPIDEKACKASRDYCKASHKIISVGRLSYPKNYEQLLSVANAVLKKHPDWTWDIYGDGELQEKLIGIIDEYKMNDKIILKGQVSDIYDRYRDYSFVVLLSRYEGFPMTLLEASANGLPMVCFDVRTGPNEIIENGKNGYLLPFGDENAAISAIEKLIDDEELRVHMSSASKRSSERFNLNEIVSQWIKLFNSLQ